MKSSSDYIYTADAKAMSVKRERESLRRLLGVIYVLFFNEQQDLFQLIEVWLLLRELEISQ